MIRRLAAGIGTLLALTISTPAWSHAVLTNSDPQDGVRLEQTPTRVTLEFTESLDPDLSAIEIITAEGNRVALPKASTESGNAKIYFVEIPSLDKGSYAISWRAFSVVDGHTTSGVITFGVMEDPTHVETSTPSSQGVSPWEATGRYLFLAGLGLVLGISWVTTGLFGGMKRSHTRLAAFATLAALAGAITMTVAAAAAAQASVATLIQSASGRGIILRFIGIAAVAIAVPIAARTKSQRWIWLLGIAAAGAILAHVAFGHAAAVAPAWIRIWVQWIHACAVGIWIGGLAALLVGVKGLPSFEKSRAIHHFSGTAGIALLVVAVTGGVRAFQEIGSIPAYLETSYGRIALFKILGIGVLALLGLYNRTRSLKLSPSTLRPLRRVGRIEVAVGLAILVATVTIAGLTPAKVSLAIARQNAPLVVQSKSTDLRTTIEVSPGTSGPNTFRAHFFDPLKQRNIFPDRVAVRIETSNPFGTPAQSPFVGQVELKRADDAFVGASNVITTSRDHILYVVGRIGSIGFEHKINLRPKCRISSQAFAGAPTIYTAQGAEGIQIQSYVDQDGVHATFFDRNGTEIGIAGTVRINASSDFGKYESLDIRQLSAGHFVAEIPPQTKKTSQELRFLTAAEVPGVGILETCFDE